MIDVSMLRDSEMFDGLSHSDLTRVAEAAGIREVEKGERLFRRGDAAETLFIVSEGRFVLTIDVRALGEERELAVEEKGPSEALGWSALVPPRESIYSAYCTLSGSVATLDRRDLVPLMEADDRLGHRLSANLNILIGDRVRTLQRLWVMEVEQHIDRINFWSDQEPHCSWSAAIDERDGAGAVGHWLRLRVPWQKRSQPPH